MCPSPARASIIGSLDIAKYVVVEFINDFCYVNQVLVFHSKTFYILSGGHAVDARVGPGRMGGQGPGLLESKTSSKL